MNSFLCFKKKLNQLQFINISWTINLKSSILVLVFIKLKLWVYSEKYLVWQKIKARIFKIGNEKSKIDLKILIYKVIKVIIAFNLSLVSLSSIMKKIVSLILVNFVLVLFLNALFMQYKFYWSFIYISECVDTPSVKHVNLKS